MKIDENGLIEVKSASLIYFLIDRYDEVVYVGQTRNGAGRAFQHHDIDFQRVMILPCDVSELDKLEDKYIKKYIPKFNMSINTVMNISLAKASRQIKKSAPTFNLRKLRKLITEKGIETFTFNGITYLPIGEYNKVEELVGLR